jgi:hypothetical protein
MKKLLILLLLMPMISFSELKPYKGEVLPLNDGEKSYTLEELGLTQEDLDNATIVLDEKEVKQWKSLCAELSGKARNEYSAKKIYKNCLDEKGLKD